MNFAVNELTNALLKKPLHECSLDELYQMARQYPYFGPAQFLLTKKLSAISNERESNLSLYEEQVQKTSLYFQNRVWLHYLLNNNTNDKSFIDHPPAIKEEMPLPEKEQYPLAEPLVSEQREAEIETNPLIEEMTEQSVVFAETIEAKTEPVAEPLVSEHRETEIATNTVTEEIIEKPVAFAETIEAKAEPVVEPLVSEHSETQIATNPLTEEITERSEVFAETIEAKAEPVAEPLLNEYSEVEPEPENEKNETPEQTAPAAEMPSLKIEPITTDTGMIFEPYHTVDYFASQGIKFREDEKPKDRFSVQLKSFTEWLKTLKRVPATSEITTTTDAGIEKKVEQMAEFSIAERHVITEAMAEVWIKQGNKAKAEDIYRKLSLLDPPKSSYFAAKIEDLKKTS